MPHVVPGTVSDTGDAFLDPPVQAVMYKPRFVIKGPVYGDVSINIYKIYDTKSVATTIVCVIYVFNLVIFG